MMLRWCLLVGLLLGGCRFGVGRVLRVFGALLIIRALNLLLRFRGLMLVFICILVRRLRFGRRTVSRRIGTCLVVSRRLGLASRIRRWWGMVLYMLRRWRLFIVVFRMVLNRGLSSLMVYVMVVWCLCIT